VTGTGPRRARTVPRWTWIASLAGVIVATAPLTPAFVERWYSTGLYAVVQPVISSWTNRVPFALLDVLIGAGLIVVIGLIRAVVRARSHRGRALVTFGARLAGLTAGTFLAFSLLWGLNYRRVPMLARLELRALPGRDEALALGRTAVAEVNRLHRPAHDAGWSNEEWKSASLRQAFAGAQRALTGAGPAEPGRLKYSMLGPYFRWTGVDGMVNPFALEVLANPDLLPFERPFVAAHEWAHLAGYAHSGVTRALNTAAGCTSCGSCGRRSAFAIERPSTACCRRAPAPTSRPSSRDSGADRFPPCVRRAGPCTTST